MPLSESVSKSRSWNMWVGTETDLRRILRLIAEAFDPLMQGHAQESSRYLRSRLEGAEQRLADTAEEAKDATGGMKAYFDERVEALSREVEGLRTDIAETESDALRDNELELNLSTDQDELRRVKGSPSELVDYLEGKTIDTIEFIAPAGNISGHKVTLKADRDSGIKLFVRSDQAQWAIATFSELTAEIERHVPRWTSVRSLWFLVAFYSITVGAVVWFVMDSIAAFLTGGGNFPSEVGEIVVVIYMAAHVSISMSLIFLTRHLIPAFELVTPGQRGAGWTAIKLVASGAIAIVLSILGNWLSLSIF
jgi:hypothetical protein